MLTQYHIPFKSVEHECIMITNNRTIHLTQATSSSSKSAHISYQPRRHYHLYAPSTTIYHQIRNKVSMITVRHHSSSSIFPQCSPSGEPSSLVDFELTINPSKSLMIYITCPNTIQFVQFGESNFLREQSHGTLQSFLKNALQFKRKRVKRNPISFVLFFSNKQTMWDGGSIYIIKTPTQMLPNLHHMRVKHVQYYMYHSNVDVPTHDIWETLIPCQIFNSSKSLP